MSVIVYRDHLLAFSETFIAAQALGLRRHTAVFAGLERRPSTVALPEDRVHVVAPGRAGRVLGEVVRRSGWLPPWWVSALQRHQPTVLHAHYALDACHALSLRRRLGVPLVVTCHGYDVAQDETRIVDPSPSFRRYLRRRPQLFAEGALFIAVSDWLRGRMIEKGFPPERTITSHVGIDLGLFDGRRSAGHGTTVVFVGRLDADKGILDLVQAMTTVAARFPAAELVVVGGGTQETAARATAASAGLRARFTGPLASTAVRDLLAQATVLCVPSRTGPTGAEEALGLAFVEAQAMGVPVVTYRLGGIPEAVIDGQTGVLLREGDIAGLATAISDLFADRVLWQRLSLAAVAHARERFSLVDGIMRLESAYERACSR